MTILPLPNGAAVPALRTTQSETSTPEEASAALPEIGFKAAAPADFAELVDAQIQSAPEIEMKASESKTTEIAEPVENITNDPVTKAAAAPDQHKTAGLNTTAEVTNSDRKDILPVVSQQISSNENPPRVTVDTVAPPNLPMQQPKEQITDDKGIDQTSVLNPDEPRLQQSDRVAPRVSQIEMAFNAQDTRQNQTQQTAELGKAPSSTTKSEITGIPVKQTGTMILMKPSTPDAAPQMQSLEKMVVAQNQMTTAPRPPIEQFSSLPPQPEATVSTKTVSDTKRSNPSSKLNHAPTETSLIPTKQEVPRTVLVPQTADRQPTYVATVRQEGPVLTAQTAPQIKSVNNIAFSKLEIQHPAAVTTQRPAAITAQSNIESSVSLLMSGDASESMNWDQIRTNTPTQTSTIALKSDLAPHVARQIGEAMAQASHRPTEIALSPKELGRVQMSVIADDGTVTINILTERPETLDLMKRHIDQLGQTLRGLGYDSINFAFGHGTRGDETTGNSPQDTSPDNNGRTEHDGEQPVEDAHPVIQITTTPTQGVDIRL